MRAYTAATTINAPAETIWAILTDAEGYTDWDPAMIRLEGTIAPGEKITAYTKLSPDRAFPVTVTEFKPNQAMTWTGGMPLGLFKGVRTFKLTPGDDGSIKFDLREEFSGPLLPLIGRSIPDMTATFADFAAGLKARAEVAAG